MSFVAEFNALPMADLLERSRRATAADAQRSIASSTPSLVDCAQLISPAAGSLLETIGRRSQALMRQRFGKTIRLLAPLYLSNECINNCSYCGFSRDNPILRVTLSVDDFKQVLTSRAPSRSGSSLNTSSCRRWAGASRRD